MLRKAVLIQFDFITEKYLLFLSFLNVQTYNLDQQLSQNLEISLVILFVKFVQECNFLGQGCGIEFFRHSRTREIFFWHPLHPDNGR